MVSRIERGQGSHVTISALERVAATLDIRLVLRFTTHFLLTGR
jgi:hypothetical protein